MFLALAVLFERILHIDLLSTKELSIHILNRHIRRFKFVVRNEAIALGLTGRGIPRNLSISAPFPLHPTTSLPPPKSSS